MGRGAVVRFAGASVFAAAFTWVVAAPNAGAQSPPQRDGAFDLAVQAVDVRQTGATPMFREVSIRCVVQNRGPGSTRGSEVLVISRPGDDGPKILKVSHIPVPLNRGDRYVIEADGAAWFASAIPYRCEIQWEGSVIGDADPSDDYGEFTYPKL
jgi:hypothetical protein